MQRYSLVRQLGVTMVEMMMVTLFAGMILYFSVRQYQSMQLDSNVQQVKSNINQISQAAAQFVYANCKPNGILDPAIYTGSSYPINVQTDLIDNGYLAEALPLNPIISNTAPSGGYRGYTAQLNKITVTRDQCTAGTGIAPSNCTGSTQIGTIAVWGLQIGVKLYNFNMATQFKSLLEANCVTSMKSNNTLVDCASAPTFASQCLGYRSVAPVPPAVYAAAQAAADAMGCPTGASQENYNNYLSVERSAAMPNTGALSPMWVSNPAVAQFKQMYTTYPMSILTSQSHSPEIQYFYCGSYK